MNNSGFDLCMSQETIEILEYLEKIILINLIKCKISRTIQ